MRSPELFVGGPLGGQRRLIPEGDFTRIELALDGKAPPPFSTSAATCTVDYRRHRWSTPQGEIAYWAPVEMTPMATILLLMGAYEIVRSVQQ